MAFTQDLNGHKIMPFLMAVANNELPGYEYINKFGHSDGITARSSIWDGGGLYPWSTKTAEQIINVASTNATDASGDVGATTVQIFGLDGNWDQIDEIVTLTGQTIKAMTKKFLRIFRMKVLAAGSTGENAGTISAFTGTATAGVPDDSTLVYAKIIYDSLARFTIGENQTLMCPFTVPRGKIGYFSGFHYDTNKSITAELWIRVRKNGEVFQTKFRGMMTTVVEPPENAVVVIADEMSDIDCQAATETTGGDFACTYYGVLVDKPVPQRI